MDCGWTLVDSGGQCWWYHGGLVVDIGGWYNGGQWWIGGGQILDSGGQWWMVQWRTVQMSVLPNYQTATPDGSLSHCLAAASQTPLVVSVTCIFLTIRHETPMKACDAVLVPGQKPLTST